jgi:cysteinyl-tRNA synthetase
MSLRIYNTLSRKKEPFEPGEAGRVKLYVCGPTVYDQAHIGHAMSAIVFDVARRFLEYRGFQVAHVMNYTDVEDKVIQRAQELGVEPLELAERYIDEFDDLLRRLNILPATHFPRASQEIDQIIDMVQGLIDRQHAYQIDGDVYFRVASDEDYGRLSGRKLEDMRAGARLEIDERKDDPADFALWKSAKPGEPAWDSPWGSGRPGWHIECSAMNLRYLGEQIDIHGGGNDLIFPHHENEIAQTEAFTCKPFARYWMHNGMLQLRGEKMSKSVGNLISVEAFLAEHEADVFRLMVLNSSYRSPLSYSDEIVEQARRGLERLRGGLRPATGAGGDRPSAGESLLEKAAQTRRDFEAAMDDDFNTAGALSALFELVRAINQARDKGATRAELAQGQNSLRDLAAVLGLRLEPQASTISDLAPFIELLLDIRAELRAARQFELADQIRNRLNELGVVIEDTKDGSLWRRS